MTDVFRATGTDFEEAPYAMGEFLGFLLDLLTPVWAFLGGLYDFDQRPESRSLTLGCGAAAPAAAAVVAFLATR